MFTCSGKDKGKACVAKECVTVTWVRARVGVTHFPCKNGQNQFLNVRVRVR